MGVRSAWKGPYVDPKLLKKVSKALSDGKFSVIKTWSRSSTILPNFVGLNISVYNGKKFVPVLINEKMVGKKLGVFAPTRIFNGHIVSKK